MTTQLATEEYADAVAAAVVDSAPGTLDTLNELAAALGDDANFAATVTTALAGKQPLDSDLTAIAALTTTSYGRAFLALADAAAGRTALGLGTAATHATGDYDAAGAAAAAQAASQPLDADLTTLAGLTATTDNMIQSVASAWASRTPTQVKTALALNNLDNTSDANKPVSTAQQTALNLKANLASPTFTGTVTIPTGASITAPTGLVKGDVGLGNVDNTSDATKNAASVTLTNKTLTSPVLNTGVSGTAIDTDATMAANSDTILATQKATKTALALKAPIASPTFTGTVSVGPNLKFSVDQDGAALFGAIAANRMVPSSNTRVEIQGGLHVTGGTLGLDFIATELSGGVAAVDLRSTDATTYAGIGSGSSASPANRNLGTIHVGGDPGTGGVLVDVAEITCVATALFTGSSTPTKWEFRTNPVGSFHSRELALTLGPDKSAVFAGPLSGITTLSMAGALSGATNVLDTSAIASNTTNIVTATAGVLSARYYASSATLRLERVNGSAGSPSTVVNTDSIGQYQFSGASAVSGTTATIYLGARIRANATEDWSGTLGGSKLDFSTTPNGSHTLTVAMTIDQDQSVKLAGNVGFYNTTPVAQRTSGADLTNNVTSGGTNDTITNWTNLSTYSTDAAAIRNAVYQLARKLKQVNDGLRALGLFT